MLGCEPQDPSYSYDTVKQITTDPTELLEIQSSFSREIENEILQMHNAKYIENEIAADAAATELERIGGSFGDGSFVGVNENGEDRESSNIVLINLDQQVKPDAPNARLVSNGQYAKLEEPVKDKEHKSSSVILNGPKNRRSDDNRENMTEENMNQEKTICRSLEEVSAAQNKAVPSGSGQLNHLKEVNGTTDNSKSKLDSRTELPKQKISPRNKSKTNKKTELKRTTSNQNAQKRNGSTKETVISFMQF